MTSFKLQGPFPTYRIPCRRAEDDSVPRPMLAIECCGTTQLGTIPGKRRFTTSRKFASGTSEHEVLRPEDLQRLGLQYTHREGSP